MTALVHEFQAASRLSPARAGDLAYRLFCRPKLSPHASPEHDALVGRARIHLDKAEWLAVPSPVGTIQAYIYEPAARTAVAKTVLLVHGWTSEASFMSAFVEPLRQRGHRVVSFDFPAHGRSSAREASMMDCARAMQSVIRAIGPIDAVVAHSVGSLVSLMVAEGHAPLPQALPIGRFVLIAPPNQLKRMTDRFADHLGLSPAARRVFEHHLERVGHRSVTSLSSASLLAGLGAPALIVHCRDDAEIPFADAEEIARACPSARLVPVDALGHARVLYAPPVVRMVRDFLDLVDERLSVRR